jgi:hypothetical protein
MKAWKRNTIFIDTPTFQFGLLSDIEIFSSSPTDNPDIQITGTMEPSSPFRSFTMVSLILLSYLLEIKAGVDLTLS